MKATRLAILPALAVLAACGAGEAPERGIRVGLYGALTGPTATFGVSEKNGATLAAEQINASGGVLGKRIVLRSEDDRGEATEAASVVSKLITRDHVVAIVGENASTRSLAGAPICQSYGVPMITPTSTNPEVTRKGDFIFRVCYTDNFQGEVLARYARRALSAQTAAVLVDIRNDYSVGLGSVFREKFVSLGGTIVTDQRYAEGDSDFSAQLTAIRAKKPDLLFVPGYYTDAGLIVRQARSLGLECKLLGGDGWDSPKLVELGGAAVEGAEFSNHYAADDPSPAVAQFVSRYQQVYGALPDSVAALSYDAMTLLADAIRRAGSTEARRIRDALAATRDFAGVSGVMTMDADRNPIKSVVILRVEGGKFRYVTSIRP